MTEKKKRKRRKKKKVIKIKKKRSSVNFSFLSGFMKQNRKKLLRGLGTVLALAAVLVMAVLILQVFKVRNVIVEGNIHYTVEEIQKMVMGEKMGGNSIYLFLKYRNKQIEDIPFIESMNITIESPNTVRITVYEKSFAGYIEYMGQYFYFDQDGTVVESSDRRTEGIPQIVGLKFDHVVLLEPLPVDDESIFLHILDISQLLHKYEISADKIYFDSEYHITLYFDDCRIKLGGTEYIDEKIMKLKMILPEIQGKKGVLRMENYSPNSSNVTFEVEN